MKRGRDTRWYVDWAGQPDEPLPGHVVARLTPTQQCSYWRVLAVHTVKTRAPIKPPHVARYRVTVEFIAARLPDGMRVDWSLSCYPRKPKRDRFSPLL